MKQDRYRIYGNDDDMCGVPFPNIFLKEVSASGRKQAIRKFYKSSSNTNWPLYSLSARKVRRKK